MKRRNFFRTLAAAPAAPALLGQQRRTAAQDGAAPEDPKLAVSVADAAADPMPRFFNAAQYAALEKLSETVMPGAVEAGAAAFLDFLIGRSDEARRNVYIAGLDGLNARGFASLASLNKPWTFEEPADPVERFLRVAKADIRMATLNSAANSAGKRFAGSGLYWYPLG
ncbi:MAG: hypothetical protein KGN84_15420 [Acidobacteriota bacterium]|nr:hypothetical protein [Acidobacteriota bacterium]